MAGLDDRSSAKDDGTTRCYGIASGTTARSRAHCQARQTRWASDRRGVKGEASSVQMGIALILTYWEPNGRPSAAHSSHGCDRLLSEVNVLPPSVLRFPQVRA